MTNRKKLVMLTVIVAALACTLVWRLWYIPAQEQAKAKPEPPEPPKVFLESVSEEVPTVSRSLGEGIDREMTAVVMLTKAEDSLFIYVPEQYRDEVQVEEEYYYHPGEGKVEVLREMCILHALKDGGWKLPLKRRGAQAETAYYTIMYGEMLYDLRVEYPVP